MKIRRFSLSAYPTPKHMPQPAHCDLSHDLSNCVSIIVGECELLLDLIPDNAEARRRVNVISHTALRMTRDLRTRVCPKH